MAGKMYAEAGVNHSTSIGAACGATLALVLVLVAACGGTPTATAPEAASPADEGPMEIIALPSPRSDGPLSLEGALAARRSVRELAPDPLTLEEIGQLLWAAQGTTDPERLGRTSPSAGGLYPLEVYAATADGLFRYVPGYVPGRHTVERLRSDDLRLDLRRAALDQAAVGEAPVVLVITVVPERTATRYGEERAVRFVDLEAGHAAQNVLLQAVALGLAAVPIGAFDDAGIASVLGLDTGEEPRYLVPVGRPR